MLADEVDFVVGVDPHRDQHALAFMSAPTGGVVTQRSVRANARGYAEAVRFAERDAPGRRVWAVEGAGHYGAGFARYLSNRGEPDLTDLRSKRIVLTQRGIAAVGVIRDAVAEMEAAWEQRLGSKHFTQLRSLLLELQQPA